MKKAQWVKKVISLILAVTLLASNCTLVFAAGTGSTTNQDSGNHLDMGDILDSGGNKVLFFSSFEKNDEQPVSIREKALNIDSMSTTIPGWLSLNAENQNSSSGWTGDKALQIKGTHTGTGEGYIYNSIYDVNIPVTNDTKLSYVIFPAYSYSYDFNYTSMYIAIDLKFTDGTFLSELEATDQNGNILSPLEQGKSRALTARQWNKISSQIGEKAAGKTIDKILVGYHNIKGAEHASSIDFETYIDDIKIENSQPLQYNHLSDYVSILRGTNDSENFSRGLTAPVVTRPHGFNFWAPRTQGGNKIYHYQHNELQGITISHEPSYWIGDRGTWMFMVNTNDGYSLSAQFRHENEIAKAHYYSVQFTEGNAAGAKLELTPTDHAAIIRLTFNQNAQHRIISFDNMTLSADGKSFTAVSNHTGNGMKQMHIYGEFGAVATSNGYNKVSFEKAAQGDTVVTMKIATSFISSEQAKKNLQLEVANKSFDQVYKESQAIWDDLLGKIEIEGASEEQKITFYSNLYRMFAYPNQLAEQTGAGTKDGWQYASPYGSDVVDGKLYYNNGFWDTYRTTWAAYALLTPEKDTELLNGLVQHYIDEGWVPRWIAPGGVSCMVGTNSDVIFGDAAMRGIDFDWQNAYESALKNASVVSNHDPYGRGQMESSVFKGYTSNRKGEGMSWSIESYINDYGIAQFAKKLSEKADRYSSNAYSYNDEYKYYLNRAQNYVNLFDEKDGGWFRGKNDSGSFGSGAVNPIRWGGDYTETNAWNMAFTVPQDGRGLANLYGGKEELSNKLDGLFSTKGTYEPGAYGNTIHEMKEAREVKLGQYGHSNQPSHHIPYMYNFTDKPYRTQEIVRDILARCYVGSSFGQGYIGDEDNGEMSAWYIFSALGFYPLNMGSGEYAIGSPLFTKATIHLENGKDIIVNAPNNSKKNIYVESIKLNGVDHNKTYFLHSDLVTDKNVTIDFEMGSSPSNWGTSENAAPTSITKDDRVPKPVKDLTKPDVKIASAIPPIVIVEDMAFSAETDSVEKLFDNSSNTSASFTATEGKATVYYSLAMPTYVEMYTITSDAANRGPTAATLYGSVDAQQWVELDSRSDIAFKWDKYTRPFAIEEGKISKYSHYKLELVGSSSIEIAELELIGDADKSIDVEYLRTVIQNAEKLDIAGKPSSLVNELKKAIDHAKVIASKESPTQDEITDTVNALKAAIARLDLPVKDAYVDHFEAEGFDETQGISIDNDSSRSGGKNIGGVQHNEWVKYNNVNFGDKGAKRIEVYYSSSSSNNEAVEGEIQLILDTLSNQPAAVVKTKPTGSGWSNYILNGSDILPSITGLHDVYLKFVSQPGKYVGNVDYIKFTENLEPAAASVTPNIENQPAAQTVTEGKSALFSVTSSAADNGTLTYQWQMLAKEESAAWADISGATDATYQIAKTTLEDSGKQFRCIVTNTKDSLTPATATSNTAELTVKQASETDKKIKNAVNPEDKTVKFGTEVSKLGLPDAATVTLEDDTTAEVPVMWNTESYDGSIAGEYTFVGTLVPQAGIINSDNITLKIKVTVEQKTEQPSKDALLALIQSAKEMAKDSKYTEESRDALTKAIETAQAVADNHKATEQQIADAENALQNAINASEEVQPEKPSKEALLTLIASAKEMAKDSKYTQASRDTLTKAIAAAQAVADNDKATEQEIAEAEKALQDAVDALVNEQEPEKPSKEALLKLIASAEEMAKDSKYTQASRDALTKAIATAQAVADNDNATEQEIAEAQKALQSAIKALVKQGGSDKPSGGSSQPEHRKHVEPNMVPSSDLSEKLASSGKGTDISVRSDYKVATGFLNELMKSKDKSVTLNGDWYSWTFDGKNVENNMPGVIWFDTRISTESPNADAIGKLTGEADTTNLYFNYEGQLPGETVIRVQLEKYTGKPVYVYYHNPEKGRLELIQADVKADEDGWIEFSITHCSDYVVSASAIKGAVKVTEPAPAREAALNPEPKKELNMTNPETGGIETNTKITVSESTSQVKENPKSAADEKSTKQPSNTNIATTVPIEQNAGNNNILWIGAVFIAAALTGSFIIAKRKFSKK